jgi:hypothetical protein
VDGCRAGRVAVLRVNAAVAAATTAAVSPRDRRYFGIARSL